MSITEYLEKVAIHEAGHYFMNNYYGIHPFSVSFNFYQDDNGEFSDCSGSTNIKFEQSFSNLDQIVDYSFKRGIIALAGVFSEAYYSGKINRREAHQQLENYQYDDRIILQESQFILTGIKQQSLSEIMLWMEDTAEKIINDNYVSITKLKDLFLKKMMENEYKDFTIDFNDIDLEN